MKKLGFLFLAATILSGCQEQSAGQPMIRAEIGRDGAETVITNAPEEQMPEEAAASPASVCQAVEFEGVALTHCVADPALHRIKTALAPVSGERFGTIQGWADGEEIGNVAFAMNGGAFGDDLRPLGYFVRDSERLSELNRGDGDGNFFMKPNGVFFGTGENWRILEAEAFVRTVGTRPEFGTQSGPMLVIDGELHPEIAENGSSRAIRNGVGIGEDGKAHFVISDAPLSFGQLARFYRDELDVPNALFLNANTSSLWDPASGRMDDRRVGPILVVETQ